MCMYHVYMLLLTAVKTIIWSTTFLIFMFTNYSSWIRMVTFFLFSGTIQSTPILQVLLVFLWFYWGREEAYGRIDCRKWFVLFFDIELLDIQNWLFKMQFGYKVHVHCNLFFNEHIFIQRRKRHKCNGIKCGICRIDVDNLLFLTFE